MAVRLPAVTGSYAWRRVYTIDGMRYRLRLWWLARAGAWYATVTVVSTGVDVIAGHRVIAGQPWSPGARARGGPDGVFVALDLSGSDRPITAYSDLGDSHQLVFIPTSEIPEPASDAALSVTRTGGTEGA